MVRRGDFVSGVPLPPGLDLVAIRKAIDYIERELAELVDLYDEQANVFSALVGIFGMKALDAVSAYEKHRHADKAQQRFPDLDHPVGRSAFAVSATDCRPCNRPMDRSRRASRKALPFPQ